MVVRPVKVMPGSSSNVRRGSCEDPIKGASPPDACWNVRRPPFSANVEAMFALDPRIADATIPVGDLPLCSVLLQNDARFPWLVLVPRRADLSEVTDLSDSDAGRLMEEVRIATRVMLDLSRPDKVNVAALGNVVPQLHVHVVGRFRSDPAWPGPVWGLGEAKPYPAHAAAGLVERAAALFAAA